MNGYLASIVARSQAASAAPVVAAATPLADPFEAEAPEPPADTQEPAGESGTVIPIEGGPGSDTGLSEPATGASVPVHPAIDTDGLGWVGRRTAVRPEAPGDGAESSPTGQFEPLPPVIYSPRDGPSPAPAAFRPDGGPFEATTRYVRPGAQPPADAAEITAGTLLQPVESTRSAAGELPSEAAAPLPLAPGQPLPRGLTAAPGPEPAAPQSAPHITIGSITVQVTTVAERAAAAPQRPTPRRAAPVSAVTQAPLRLRLGLGQM